MKHKPLTALTTSDEYARINQLCAACIETGNLDVDYLIDVLTYLSGPDFYDWLSEFAYYDRPTKTAKSPSLRTTGPSDICRIEDDKGDCFFRLDAND
jgi:hypothetical protein